MALETVAAAGAIETAVKAAKTKLPTSVAVLVLLIGVSLIAIGWYGPGTLGFRDVNFSGGDYGGAGGGSGGAR